MEIQRLRVENAKLRAQLIGRDRTLANARYRCAQQTNELQADVDQERINARAQQLLPDLRDVLGLGPDVAIDWTTGEPVPAEETQK